MKTIRMNFNERSYDILVGGGLLNEADKHFDLDRKVFIITDKGVPSEYSLKVKSLSKDALIYTVEGGENSKSPETLIEVLLEMSRFGMGRTDAVVAVGGGVVGDLSGFAASIYMRGIDFYNIPTTVLSAVDSSIGGKTAINLGGIKNNVGSFYQPRGVIIDPNTLTTLPKRHISAGLAESLKMAVTFDDELFSKLESLSYDKIVENIESIIISSLEIKKSVVEKDECESDIRKTLNFGHTYGHAIEKSVCEGELYHGECVALGMLPMLSEDIFERVKTVLKKLSLPTEYSCSEEKVMDLIQHDKKRKGEKISVILSDKIGSYTVKDMTASELSSHIKSSLKSGWRK